MSLSTSPSEPVLDAWRLLPNFASQRVAETPVVLVGTGAVGRPLANLLTTSGFQRFLLVDPAIYAHRNLRTQCSPSELERPKAIATAEDLQSLCVTDVQARVCGIEDLQLGELPEQALVIAAVDHRAADIAATRMTLTLRSGPLVKVNVEPYALTASIRAYHLAGEVEVCPVCQFTARQIDEQRPRRSCDGSAIEPRATGSPRALCHVAASAAALACAQIIGSPDDLAKTWIDWQWQLSLRTGVATRSRLMANPACRMSHERPWDVIERLDARGLTLRELLQRTPLAEETGASVSFSSPVCEQVVCNHCRSVKTGWQAVRADDSCACGGTWLAAPLSTFTQLPLERLASALDQPFSDWQLPTGVLIGFSSSGQRVAFLCEEGRR
jgi:hypothetical protein